MITRNDIGLAATGQPLVIVPRLHKLAVELLKECDAYREGWIKQLVENSEDGSIGSFAFSEREDADKHVDAEVQRLVESMTSTGPPKGGEKV